MRENFASRAWWMSTQDNKLPVTELIFFSDLVTIVFKGNAIKLNLIQQPYQMRG